MEFLESPRMPENIAFGAIGGPGFSTTVVATVAGFERRNMEWSKVRYSYDISTAIQSESDFRQVRNHFLAVGGRHLAFRFKDHDDYKVTFAESGVDQITGTTVQLIKRYPFGLAEYRREIKKPVASAPFVVKDGATTLVSGTDFSLDATTGVVTFTSPRTASGITWSGEFDVPVRFDTDELKRQIVNRKAGGGEYLQTWDSIPLVEVRL